MGAKTCADTIKAVKLVEGGMSKHAASLKLGLAYSTVIRACNRLIAKRKKISSRSA